MRSAAERVDNLIHNLAAFQPHLLVRRILDGMHNEHAARIVHAERVCLSSCRIAKL